MQHINIDFMKIFSFMLRMLHRCLNGRADHPWVYDFLLAASEFFETK